MNIYESIVAEISAANHIIITSHKSPDGDSIGCSLGLHHFIKELGKNSTICHPDPSPEYLSWLEGSADIITFSTQPESVQDHFLKADLIFCLDYNGTDRVGEEMQKLLEISPCKKIMIDHHLYPQDFAFIIVSDTDASSTCELIAELILQSGNIALLNAKIGTPLYLGILTDSGTFRFPSVRARTHEILGKLLAGGVKHHLIHESLNDTNTIGRLRIQGYAISQKLEVIEEFGVSIISITEEEHKKYNYQKGDTDGLPNSALSIKGMKAAILFSEREGFIRISFRSKGKDNPVNVLASEHFEGGGHANAAGGKSILSMEETLIKIKNLIPLYFSQVTNKQDFIKESI